MNTKTISKYNLNKSNLDIVQQVLQDFDNRRQQRRVFEAKWVLNSNFVYGNQYCDIDARGQVVDDELDYLWQERQVYNHIAPIIETRLAKLGRVRPKMSVRPSSGDESDINTAKVASKILSSSYEKMRIDKCITDATNLSEIMGNSFYKITWDKSLGKKVGIIGNKNIYQGDIRVDVCSAYEIFVDNLFANDLSECNSVIHAKNMHIEDIKALFGKVPNKLISADILNPLCASIKGINSKTTLSNDYCNDYCIVIERYTRPNTNNPQGELVIVAGDTLLYQGALPYKIGINEEFDLPFIQQKALSIQGMFYGLSIVERCIPIQRAYNAIKNRKLEFINRLAAGVVTVEDGSVDIDNLEQYGLAPGKILSYRQGCNPPHILDSGRVPPEFNHEEDRLLNEFVNISGVSELMRNSQLPGNVSSGTAISLLIEQDDTRLSLTAQNIKDAIRELAQKLLRLYKQFASNVRIERIVGDNGEVELFSFRQSDLSSDDVIFDTENEISNTPASKQNMLFELLKVGILQDENGRLSDSTRYKLLDALGYGGWERARNLDTLHIKRAELENFNIDIKEPTVEEIDNHDLHIEIHTTYLLSCNDDENKDKKTTVLQHIKEHKRMQAEQKQLNLKLKKQSTKIAN